MSGRALADEPVVAEAAPEEQYPPPPPTGVWRPFSLTLAAGPGALFGPDEQDLAVSHNLLRFGWGLARNLGFYVSFEGVRAPSVNPHTDAPSWLRQDTLSFGVQYHFLERAYVRAGVGVGWVGEDTQNQSFSGGRGLAVTGAAGYELAQLYRTAVGVELAANLTRYAYEFWGTVGLNLTLTLF
jgi:hypothetical protein